MGSAAGPCGSAGSRAWWAAAVCSAACTAAVARAPARCAVPLSFAAACPCECPSTPRQRSPGCGSSPTSPAEPSCSRLVSLSSLPVMLSDRLLFLRLLLFFRIPEEEGEEVTKSARSSSFEDDESTDG
ncbi:hypothetical protein MT997_01655 [Paenibacillus sp. OVF10]|nr:hypothetical protein MT997_01655 [Paenibacillus sp. OVF10]